MKKYTILLSSLFLATSAFADESLDAEILSGNSNNQQTNVDLNKDLDNATSGVGRFRFGASLGGGYYKSASVENYPNMSGWAAELGGYTLFNPIRNWADVELGVRGLYVLPSDQDKKDKKTGDVYQKSYSGLISGSVYAGVVFRLPNISSAVATGIYQDFATKSRFSPKQIENTNFKNKLKYKPGQGIYVEYQWTGGDKLIPFARFTYGSYKSEYQTATQTQSNREKLFGLVFGVKF